MKSARLSIYLSSIEMSSNVRIGYFWDIFKYTDNRFNFDNKFDDIMYVLYKSDFDNSGEKLDQNTNNLNFLRTQRGYKNLTLEVDNLIFKNQTT